MRQFPKEITDPQPSTPPSGGLDRVMIRFLNDARDLPFVHLSLQVSVILVPFAVFLFLPVLSGWMWYLAAIAYLFVNTFIFKASYGLMFHCVSHRPWIKGRLGVLVYQYLNWIIGPLFGQTPHTYRCHHLGMHHRENNMEADDSSTLGYLRDSLRSFHCYFLSFFLTAVYNLTAYFNIRKRYQLRNRVLIGEVIYWIVVIGLCFVNLGATLVVYLIPLLIARYVMMLGNFAQHAFIDADEPSNSYRNSVTCINTKYNHKCWNDGYHISHHLRPNLHWTEHPNHLKTHLAKYAENQAMVFEGIGFLQVWYFLMCRNYHKLASHLVNIDNTFNSTEEAIALMKARTRKLEVG